MRFITLLLALIMPGLVMAWQPTQTIDMTVPFPPGSGNDIVARILSAQIEKDTGAKITVTNRAGAGGTIGTQHLSRQPADGHHALLFSVGGLAAMDKTFPAFFEKPPYTVADFTYISLVGRSTLVFVTNANSGVTAQQMVDQLLTQPVTIADSGGAGRLALELLLARIDQRQKNPGLIRVEHRGPAETITDLAGGHVKFGVVPLSVALPHHRAGKVRIVAVSASTPHADLPGVPALGSVVKDYQAEIVWGVALPKNAQPGVVDWWITKTETALKSSDVRATLAQSLITVGPSATGLAFEQIVKRQEISADPVVKIIVNQMKRQ